MQSDEPVLDLLRAGRNAEALALAAEQLEALADEAAPGRAGPDRAKARRDLQRVAGVAAHFLADSETALRYLMTALASAEEAGDALDEAELHNDVAMVHGRDGRFDRALEHLWAAVRRREDMGDGASAAELNNIATVYVETGRFDEAIPIYLHALQCYDETEDRVNAAATVANVGWAHVEGGRIDTGIPYLDDARARFERLGRDEAVAGALVKLGHAYVRQGAFERAERAFDQALALYAGSSDTHAVTSARLGSARAALGAGDVAIALERFDVAVAGADDATLIRTRALLELSDAQRSAGKPVDALAKLRRHVALRDAADDRDADLATRVRLLDLELGVGGTTDVTRLRALELERANEVLRQDAVDLRRLSITDALTELPNRRAFDARLREEMQRSLRTGTGFALALLDVDRFKSINDVHGHDAGDRVLARLARLLEADVRSVDTVARWGGEEFALLFPEADVGGALPVLERMADAVRGAGWSDVDPDLRVTVSVGVARHAEAEDVSDLLHIADRRLFAAKRLGRDRIVSGDPGDVR